MSDSHSTDGSHALDAGSVGDRDAKLEQLLLTGLDHYFAQQYERAISVWTRCLFLDRNHARARAYIERARSALAERQRQSEELLQDGFAAFRRGDASEARRLMRAAIDAGAPADEAFALLSRLDRLEQADQPIPPIEAPWRPLRRGAPPPLPTSQIAVEPAAPRRRARVGMTLGLLVAAAALGVVMFALSSGWEWPQFGGAAVPDAGAPIDPGTPEVQLPVPRRGEMNLARARALAAGGHLHDALTALDGIRPTDLERPAADDLRANIQQQLLALVSTPSVRASTGTDSP